jgi:hypothetical protein
MASIDRTGFRTRHVQIPRGLFGAFLLLAAIAQQSPLRAAEGYDTCGGRYIDSLPANISTQGVWCLRRNLATAITAGTAINIGVNNVTIDCNDFGLDGLAAGEGTLANGIYAGSRQNIAIRHCNIRGFYRGILLSGSDGGGHAVEDNRFRANRLFAIGVYGDRNTVARNTVLDSGASTKASTVYAIYAAADILDNAIANVAVHADWADGSAYGIAETGAGNLVRHNRIGGLVPRGNGIAVGIAGQGTNDSMRDNAISAPSAGTSGDGIVGNASGDGFCGGNTISNFTTAIANCQSIGGNYSH